MASYAAHRPRLRVSCHAVSRCHVSREDVLSPENNDVSVSTSLSGHPVLPFRYTYLQ